LELFSEKTGRLAGPDFLIYKRLLWVDVLDKDIEIANMLSSAFS
jgi:hypothetical protein